MNKKTTILGAAVLALIFIFPVAARADLNSVPNFCPNQKVIYAQDVTGFTPGPDNDTAIINDRNGSNLTTISQTSDLYVVWPNDYLVEVKSGDKLYYKAQKENHPSLLSFDILNSSQNVIKSVSYTTTGQKTESISQDGFVRFNKNTKAQEYNVLAICPASNPPQAPTADIKANGSDGPITIQAGSSATITWTSQNAATCSVSPNGWSGTNGSQSTGALNSDTNYVVSCSGAGGTATDSVLVKVESAPNIPSCPLANQAGRTIVNFNNKVIKSNGSYTDARTGAVATNIPAGNYDITLVSYDNHSQKNQTQTQESWYLILRDANGGTIANSSPISDLPDNQDLLVEKVDSNFPVSQAVKSVKGFHAAYPSSNANSVVPICAAFDEVSSPPQAPTADIKANGSDGPITIQAGSSATITWTSQNAATCSVSPNGWNGTNGSQSTGALNSDTNYVVSCSGAGGTATDSVLVKVESAPQTPTADIKANGSDGPITIQAGSSATITWTS